MLKFSKHAEDKLRLYGLIQENLLNALEKPLYICEDKEKNSVIYIVELEEKPFSVVVKDDVIITVYRTDLGKLNSRIRSGRWSCRNYS